MENRVDHEAGTQTGPQAGVPPTGTESDCRDRSLAAFQQTALLSLMGPFASPHVSIDPNFKIYREYFFFQLREISYQIFKVTRRIYESKFRMKSWDHFCEEFIRKNPPRDPRIAWAFESFPEKLSTEPWIKELALYEWLRFLVVQGTVNQPSNPGALNSTLVLRKFQHSLPDWYSTQISNAQTKPNFPIPDCRPAFVAFYMDSRTFELREVKLDLTRFDLLSDWKRRGVPRENFEYLGQSDPSWKFLLDLLLVPG